MNTYTKWGGGYPLLLQARITERRDEIRDETRDETMTRNYAWRQRADSGLYLGARISSERHLTGMRAGGWL